MIRWSGLLIWFGPFWVFGCGGTGSGVNDRDAAVDLLPAEVRSDQARTGDDGGPPSDLGVPVDAGYHGSGRAFPDTSARIAILADQLPGGLTMAQQQFVVTHYVGTQKLTLDLSKPLRALNPAFLVLHYHLANWQSAPGVSFITDGRTWSNDYPAVSQHESWFWHNQSAQRVASNVDGKLLMNLADPGFRQYWADSLARQTEAGDYDGIFADSASPALLNFEAQRPPEPRLQATGVKDTKIAEWGDRTYVEVWQEWIAALDATLAAQGIPLIPNTSAFVTTWDTTRYDLTAGAFVEGFASPRFSTADWKASTNQLLKLAARGKIIILQNYLSATTDTATRTYYLANYLLVKGGRTYLDYFAKSPLEWYPEWGVDLGTALNTGMTVDDLLVGGVYRREYQRGAALVNPTGAPVTVVVGAGLGVLGMTGGGGVPADGTTPGVITKTAAQTIVVPAYGAAIFVK